jgi:uncharacterized protein (DUF427 family)
VGREHPYPVRRDGRGTLGGACEDGGRQAGSTATSSSPRERPTVCAMENVWDYPRPPVLVPCERRVRIELGGVRIVDSAGALRVLETSHPPTIYIPLADIADGALRPAAGGSFCEWKGDAHYYDVLGGDRVEARAAWGYATPAARFAELRDHACFYPSRMDACFLDEERVRSQEGDFYGGWITDELVGPFKGGPGTLGW